ncbi:MAG: glycosyltransferase, partial [Intestinibacter bartlettii]
MHKFRAAIHHGGNGTVHCCLEFGVPQLIFAFGADQLFWGQQCYELGIGPSPIYVKNKLNMDEIKEKVNELINMKKYKENSEKLKKYITKDGVKVAANIIEKKFKVGNNKDERRNK